MSKLEAVITAADFLDEVAGLIEFKQPRVGASVIDKNMAFGVGRDRDRFAEVLRGRKFQQARHRCEWDLGHMFDSGFALGKGRRGGQHHQSN